MWMTIQGSSTRELLSLLLFFSVFVPRPAEANLLQLSARSRMPATMLIVFTLYANLQALFRISCFFTGWYLPGTLLAAIASRFQELMAVMASVRSDNSFSLKC